LSCKSDESIKNKNTHTNEIGYFGVSKNNPILRNFENIESYHKLVRDFNSDKIELITKYFNINTIFEVISVKTYNVNESLLFSIKIKSLLGIIDLIGVNAGSDFLVINMGTLIDLDLLLYEVVEKENFTKISIYGELIRSDNVFRTFKLNYNTNCEEIEIIFADLGIPFAT
jgi:hypothetical protein